MLRICFVHTPMCSVQVEGRNKFWYNFDKRYYAVHSALKPTDASIWELPHWMIWLGGVLKSKGFTDIKTFSLYTAVDILTGLDQAIILKDIQENPSDVYLYSPMTPNLHLALEIASLVKFCFPNSINVFGGVIATPQHKQIASRAEVDIVVRDRGEIALPELLKALQGNQPVENVKNLSYKNKTGAIITHSKLYSYLEPKNIPDPYIELFPKDVGPKLRYIRQNYALGCPFKCSFCTIQTIGRKPNYFPVERVLNEIKQFRAHYGEYHNIYFGDETFTVNKEKTKEICSALRLTGNITYDIQTRLENLVDKPILLMLSSSGCRWVEVGIETLIQKSMPIHKQNTNLMKVKEILFRLRDHGLPVCSFIVNGLPEQTLDEMRYSIDKVCSLLEEGLLHASYFFGLVPYPGSIMYDKPECYGLKIKHHDYKYYNEELVPVYDTHLATSDEIYKVFLEGVQKIGQAMSSQPCLGTPLPVEFIENLGKSLVHV